MFKIAICDDDIDCAKGFAKILDNQFLKKSFKAKVTIITNNQSVIYNAIKEKKVDLLILDIIFKNSSKNGMEFANELRKTNKNFYLVFFSAHLRYMHLSFLSKTFDFLVKPLNRDVVDDFVDRIINEFSINNNKFLHINKNLIINIDDILYIEKLGNKSYIYTTTEKYSCTITLYKLLDELPNNFIKCYRSFIVNKNFISTIDIKNNIIILKNGSTCPVSPNFKLEE